jgi:ABC-type Mn2+/Zn2+ transport system permease subunit
MAGLAAFVGILLHQYYSVDEEWVILGMLSLFVGIGLIIFYMLASKRINK